MNWEIPPETIEQLNCPECGVSAAISELRYGYPSPTYWRDSKGYLHKNYYPSVNVYCRCFYCGLDEPEEYFKFADY